jgi:hypothetical protein
MTYTEGMCVWVRAGTIVPRDHVVEHYIQGLNPQDTELIFQVNLVVDVVMRGGKVRHAVALCPDGIHREMIEYSTYMIGCAMESCFS